MTGGPERIQARVHEIKTLLGENDPPNEAFGRELRQATATAEARPKSSSPPGAYRAHKEAPEWMQPMIQEAAGKTGVPAELITSVIANESAFRPNAVSPVGAGGLMQLMPGTARGLGVTDRFDPRQNIMGGSEYLRQQLNRFGSVEKAVAAYNAGPGAVQKYGGVPPYRETQNYVKKVTGLFQRLVGRRE